MKNSTERGTLNNSPSMQGPNTIFSFLQKSNANPAAFFIASAPRAQAPVNSYSIEYLSSLLERMKYLISLQEPSATPTPKR